MTGEVKIHAQATRGYNMLHYQLQIWLGLIYSLVKKPNPHTGNTEKL